MSLTKELVEQERQQLHAGCVRDVHLHKEGSFLRAYNWSAFLCCRLLHDFKAGKRVFKGVEEPVAYIGFPETSLSKWIPEGAEQRMEDEKHLVITLPEVMVVEPPEVLAVAYTEWKTSVPLSEPHAGKHKRREDKELPFADDSAYSTPASLTSVMQRVLAWPQESKSPLETMT